jgi:hypothetical protein
VIAFGATIRWRHGGQRGFALWIPLFLLWLVLLPVALVLFPLICIACWCMGVNAIRLYTTAWRFLASLRHTLIEVEQPDHAVRIHIA